MSLIEIMIAIGILGLGLTMVATIFPLALNQHRISTDHILAADVARRTQSIMRNRSVNVPDDGNVYVYPYEVLAGNGYFASNDIRALNEGNSLGSRIAWDDVLYPAQAGEALDRRQRYTWISFARSDQGITQYTVFVCRRIGGERFALQDITTNTTGTLPTDRTKAATIRPPTPPTQVFLPCPWRIRVVRNAQNQFQLFGTVSNLSLSQLVTNGSRLLSQPTGRLYTVVQTQDQVPPTMDVLEDTSGEPAPTVPPSGFDLWLVPPAVTWQGTIASFARNSPVVDVLCFAGPG